MMISYGVKVGNIFYICGKNGCVAVQNRYRNGLCFGDRSVDIICLPIYIESMNQRVFVPLFLLLLLVLGRAAQAKAPKPIDVAQFKCTYRFKFLTDSMQKTYRDKDLYVVEIGAHSTKSYCYQTFYVDSLNSTPSGRAKHSAEFNARLRSLPSNPSGAEIKNVLDGLSRGWFQFYVYKDYQKEKITITDNISLNYFTYEDELKPQDWTVGEDTMEMLGYTCQQATCTFRGRNWEAWFAPAIPIAEGPWKFYGLPGLIMKLEDTEGHYCFEMIGLQQVEMPMYITLNKHSKNSRKIDRMSFLNLRMKRTGIDLGAMDLESVGIRSDSEVLHYDYIERDYKE
jgi:GLPGLI family protein